MYHRFTSWNHAFLEVTPSQLCFTYSVPFEVVHHRQVIIVLPSLENSGWMFFQKVFLILLTCVSKKCFEDSFCYIIVWYISYSYLKANVYFIDSTSFAYSIFSVQSRLHLSLWIKSISHKRRVPNWWSGNTTHQRRLMILHILRASILISWSEFWVWRQLCLPFSTFSQSPPNIGRSKADKTTRFKK